ncbi:MAG: mechanosensitive ion channel [Calditrichae bacterium]|nr:mechanosensitive ion channel [Calditrichota bacterium]MCB9058185.1 mechanosensitive ion channel [Calditrichia bacterium]
MIEYLEFEFSEFSLIGVTILAVILAILLKTVKHVVIKKLKRKAIKEYYPLLEVALWFIFIFWSINVVLKDSFYHMIAIISLAIIVAASAGWFIVRDLFAGIVLRFSDHFIAGQFIQIGQQSGQINQVGLLSLSVQQENGAVVKIPWSRINGSIYSKTDSSDKINRLEFPLEVSNSISSEILYSRIRQAILLSTGCSLNREPQLQIINNGDKQRVNITAYALSPDYFTHIESNVKNAIKEF